MKKLLLYSIFLSLSFHNCFSKIISRNLFQDRRETREQTRLFPEDHQQKIDAMQRLNNRVINKHETIIEQLTDYLLNPQNNDYDILLEETNEHKRLLQSISTLGTELIQLNSDYRFASLLNNSDQPLFIFLQEVHQKELTIEFLINAINQMIELQYC